MDAPGPQTVGELRGRTARLYPFDDLEAVDACLVRLMEWEPGPLVTRLPRQVGYKEVRYAHLLSGEPQVVLAVAQTGSVRETRDDSVARLQATVDRLEADVADLKRQFGDFKRVERAHRANPRNATQGVDMDIDDGRSYSFGGLRLSDCRGRDRQGG